jgi:T5SS/PEP-CTERM-associated repeat protein
MLVGVVCLVSSADAQFSANHQTNTIDTATNWVGNYYVGSNTAFDVLQVVNGGVLTNAFGYLGYTTAGSNNLAVVDGTGGSASWINSTNLVVGQSGKFNQLLVVGGGKVSSPGYSVVGYNTGANSNSVTVAGSGSVWTNNGMLHVGYQGTFNQMIVSNGGVVISSGGFGANAGTGIGDSSSGNLALVAGAGSLWTNNGTFLVGRAGALNQLVVSNGGTVISGAGVIGRLANSNAVIVTGEGSAWTNTTGGITVGLAANFNQMVVTNGGRVFTWGNSTLGNNAGANSNLVTVTGGGSTWTNGGSITVGSQGSYNQLTIANGGTVLSADAQIGHYASGPGGTGNVVLVTGSGTLWTNSGLTVGGSGLLSQLLITEGGRVATASSFTIGSNAGSSNNLVLVTGSNSLWKSGGVTTYFGSSGSRNQLVVSNGGTLVTSPSSSLVIADQASAVGNSLLLSDRGSIWTNTAGLTLGRNGSFNQVVVSNGATVVGAAVTLGNFAGSTGNVLVVTGNGSTWGSSGNMVVGSAGLSNALFISEGGRVAAAAFTAGNAAGSNRVEIASGGLLEASSLTAGNFGGNFISNDGGIFQFSSGVPSVTPNGYGRISLNNGKISFRGVSNANVWGSLGSNELRNILYAGNNVFRLDSASNTHAASPQNYTFASGVSPSNYVGLEMVNGSTAWKSARLNVGSGGSLLVSNTAASIAGVFTNLGTVRVADASVTWQSNVVLSGGSYTFAGATNTFASGLTLGSGATFGGSGRVVSDSGVTSAGTLSPGNSPGTMSYSSNLTLLGSSVLLLEIAGTNAADYDHLVVEGVLAAGGTLTVTNLGYTFSAGDAFDFLDFASLSGAFSVTNLPTLTGGLEWDFTQFDSQGILSIGIPIPEPSAGMALAVAGLAAAIASRFRRGRPERS